MQHSFRTGMISSTKNSRIKDLIKLSKPRERKESKLFLIEGGREIIRALKSEYTIQELFVCPEVINGETASFLQSHPKIPSTNVAPHVFSKLVYREKHDGLLAVAEMKSHDLQDFHPVEKGLYLIAENIEKPGNLGALMRTADAAALDGLFICDNQTDLYNPNVVRASLGCLFSIPVVVSDSVNTVAFLKNNEIQIFAAALQNSHEYTQADFSFGGAIAMGSEANGLSAIWREQAGMIIHIPMKGIADSLNVSVSAAILVFEAQRQRHFV